MAWFLDALARDGVTQPAIVTGKPLELEGSVGRAAATGQGVVHVVADAAKRRGIRLEGARVAIQGFGNVGASTARIIASRGARVVAVTDVDGGVYAESGLDIGLLVRLTEEKGSVVGAPGTRPISNEELFGLDVDILVLAALEGQITGANAGDVRAPILAEAANGPTTPDADPILARNDITVLPDILCNAGGVVVSYFEWAQNRARYQWLAEEVDRRLAEMMGRAADAVWARAAADRIGLRLAAQVIAIDRVATATELRGGW
jgi:glutamate dehydrogenase/leucine dehydrogenase